MRARPVRCPCPRAYLATKLTKHLYPTDGEPLVTIGDACRYMTALSKEREQPGTWQRACKLILDRAAPADVTRQVKLVLFMDAKLDLRRTA
jgi:hypothetical protein